MRIVQSPSIFLPWNSRILKHDNALLGLGNVAEDALINFPADRTYEHQSIKGLAAETGGVDRIQLILHGA